MIRILIVEDNRDLAYGLRNNLEVEGYEVRIAELGRQAVGLAVEWAPDLMILDLMLPDQDGFQVLETLRGRGWATPVLILTARGEEEDKVRGLRMGAEDYVTKPFGLLELLARIEVLLRGRKGLRGAATLRPVENFGGIEVYPDSRTVLRNGEEVDLAPKELDLLLALLRRRGAVVSRDDLLVQVWGYEASVVSRTIDTHIGELRRKLEDDPATPKHILTVRKAGYRLEA